MQTAELTRDYPEGTEEVGVEERGEERVVVGEQETASKHGRKTCQAYSKAAVRTVTELRWAQASVCGEAEKEESESF